MEIFKSHLGRVLSNLLRLILLEQGVEVDDLRRCLPVSTILCFCNHNTIFRAMVCCVAAYLMQ